jgi:putative ABC transport system permease protein
MKKFVIQAMAVKNLTRRPVRTWSMVFFVFMLSFSLMLSTVLVDSMEERLDKTTDRLGADIIVVPKEYEHSMADALFLGEKCNFTFDKKWVEEIASLEGVAACSPQLYMKSLAAGCCSAEVQLIAFEPETDFAVTAWLEDSNIKMPQRGEMIIGSEIQPETEGEVIFFNDHYKVVGQLETTRTNYDTCVFMTYETAQDIMNSEKWYEAFREKPDASKLVSSLLVRTEEGVDAKLVSRTINFRMTDDSPLSAYTSNGIMSEAIESTQSMGNYSTLLVALISILVVTALLCIFTITINERTKEFGILASLGADSRKLSGIVLTEGALIGLVGGLIGAILGTAVMLIFKNTIMTLLKVPALNTNLLYLLTLGLKCMLLALAVSVAASLYSAWKVSRNDLDGLIRGEEM